MKLEERRRVCLSCGRTFIKDKRVTWARFQSQRACSKSCATRLRMANYPLGPKTRYRKTKVDGRPISQHRAVMELKLGRRLSPSEVVHHQNEDRLDNSPDNLVLTTHEEHNHHHHPPVHPVSKACEICGAVFTPHKTKRKRQQTCSWNCRNALIAVRRHGVTVEAARARYCPEVAEAVVRANLPGIAREAVA